MKSLEVMVIDDEPAIRQIVTMYLVKEGFNVEQAPNGLSALARLSKGDIDVAICDINMPDISGIELVKRVRAAGIDTNFIMMTAYASVDTAIEAIQAGASDYMIKPVRNQELLHRVIKLGDLRGLRAENQVLRNLVQGKSEPLFAFTSPCMRELDRLINKVSPTDSTVLVTGESGTGKGVIARRIHQQSTRFNEPFIPVNCGALPEHLMESELFGHTKGAFTGADKARKGLFLEADKGTIFLDEIGELPLQLQVKLLHVIEEKSVRAVGSEQIRRADVRIIAATNRDLTHMVAAGTFRQDLYFRLSVFHVNAPPLRQRREDIPALIAFLILRGKKQFNINTDITIDTDVEQALIANNWSGNVREMENIIDRALILADEGHITFSDMPSSITMVDFTEPNVENIAVSGIHSHGISNKIPAHINTANAIDAGTTLSLRDQVRQFESSIIYQAIQQAAGDRRIAAHKLGIGLSSLYRKIDEFETFGLAQAEKNS